MGKFLGEAEGPQSVQFEKEALGELWDYAEEFTSIGNLVTEGIENLFKLLEANNNAISAENKREALESIKEAYRGWHDIKQHYQEIRDRLREMEYRITNLRG